ncbi:MAG: hypothetical protein ACFFCS_28050 [Candidatus Hodarchaeota archaeon]
MELIDTLKNWLFKKEEPKNAIRKARIKLKLFTRRLERHRLKLEMQAEIANRRAIELRKREDIESVRNFVKSYLQFSAWERGIEKFKLQLEILQSKVETGENTTDLNETLEQVGKALLGLMMLELPNIEDVLCSIDMNLDELNIIFESTGERMEIMEVTDDVLEEVTEQGEFKGLLDRDYYPQAWPAYHGRKRSIGKEDANYQVECERCHFLFHEKFMYEVIINEKREKEWWHKSCVKKFAAECPVCHETLEKHLIDGEKCIFCLRKSPNV